MRVTDCHALRLIKGPENVKRLGDVTGAHLSSLQDGQNPARVLIQRDSLDRLPAATRRAGPDPVPGQHQGLVESESESEQQQRAGQAGPAAQQHTGGQQQNRMRNQTQPNRTEPNLLQNSDALHLHPAAIRTFRKFVQFLGCKPQQV